MTVASQTRPRPLRIFYSYAREDGDLQEEVKKHLRLLEREGLIRGWDDRLIGAGTEWEGRILDELEAADVILLLVSADFIASDYIWDVEMRRALVRHRAKEALVVPVILRPCSWQTAPFAALQCLPSNAQPVVLWDPRDRGLRDVAEGLRAALEGRALAARPRAPATSVRHARVLDAAVGSVVPVGRSSEVVALVRTVGSGGLRAILEVDESYSPRPGDVRERPLELTFDPAPSGELRPATVVLRLESRDFDPPVQEKTIEVPPASDSRTCVFLVTARTAGPLVLTLELLRDGVTVVQQLLRTEGRAEVDRRRSPLYLVASARLEAPSPRKAATSARVLPWVGSTAAAMLVAAAVGTSVFRQAGGDAPPPLITAPVESPVSPPEPEPPPPPERQPQSVVEVPPPVTFAAGSVELPADELARLASAIETVLSALDAAPDALLVVEGHADEAEGSAARAMALGQGRAATVRASLVALGVPANRIRTVSLGDAQPLAATDGGPGRAVNRRVELRISDRGLLP